MHIRDVMMPRSGSVIFIPVEKADQDALRRLDAGQVAENNARLIRWSTGERTSTKAVTNTSTLTASSPAEELVKDPRVRAMLDVLVFSEGTSGGYGTVVNGKVIKAPYNPELVGKTNVTITDFSKHPEILVQVSGSI